MAKIFLFRFNNNMNEISFSGLYIKPVTIKKCINNHYVPYQASIVKMESNDLPVLHEINLSWQRPLLQIILGNPQDIGNSKHVYILTKQKDHFKTLNSKDILGMAQLREYNYDLINFLEAIQIRPDIEKRNYNLFSRFINFVSEKLNLNLVRKPKYKEVGTNLVKTIQEYHNDKKISLCPIRTSPNFYRKLGFKENGIFYFNQMTWTPPNKK